jgi:iron complex transport system substrate-binding protein
MSAPGSGPFPSGHKHGLFVLLFALVVTLAPFPTVAEIAVVDDAGNPVRLARPAHRIVSLAPHVTETLFAAGAGSYIVGTVRYSDYPVAAKAIPRIGDSFVFDLERIVALKPDLIVVWLHGNSERALSKIRALGIPIFQSEPRTLAAISSSLLRMGELAGTEPAARKAAEAYSERLERLRRKYAARPAVPLFFQAWRRPLLTVGGEQIINDAIRSCGGRNIFEDRKLLVPNVDLEAVVEANPEAIVSTGTGGKDEDIFDDWRKLSTLRAVANHNLLLVRTETLGRHSPRILEGATMLCEELEGVRARRK